MKVEIELNALCEMLKQAVVLGIMQYQSIIAPEGDRIKQREAKRYLKRLGYEPKVLDEWVDYGFIHRRKDGESQNSPVYYSLREIQRQITATEMKKGHIAYL